MTNSSTEIGYAQNEPGDISLCQKVKKCSKTLQKSNLWSMSKGSRGNQKNSQCPNLKTIEQQGIKIIELK